MIKKAIISGKEVTFDMEKVAHSGSTARIFVSNCGSFIMKVVGAPQRYCEADCYSREVFLLKHLKSHGFDWVPDILSTCDEDKSIVMTHCGVKINKDNAPPDAKEQLLKIIWLLETLKIAHNDMRWCDSEAPNILVKEGKIYLCDWGWGSTDNSLTCGGRFGDEKLTNPNLLSARKSFWKWHGGEVLEKLIPKEEIPKEEPKEEIPKK